MMPSKYVVVQAAMRSGDPFIYVHGTYIFESVHESKRELI